MAERIMKVRECDRLDCRHRKGVRKVEVVLTIESDQPLPVVAVGPEPVAGKPEMIRDNGELCPLHLEMAKAQIVGWFKNAKKY